MLRKLQGLLKPNSLIPALLLLVFVGVRFVWLDRFPPGLNHDETDVILSAKNYWLNGADISGVRFPRSLFFTNTEAGLSGLPSVLLSSFIGPAKLTLANIRIPYVIINIASALVISAIVLNLTRNKILSFITLTITLTNPVFFYYSRAATEVPFALLFVLIGIFLLFIKNNKKLNYISIVFYMLAFYSYFGAKPVVPVLSTLLLLIHKIFYKYSLRFYVIYILCFSFMIASYFVVGSRLPGNTLSERSSELTITNVNRFQNAVIEKRTASIEFPLKSVFFNKYVLLFDEISSKYLGWLSDKFLFEEGDPRATYKFGEHGIFYLIDFIFIILGIYGLGKLNRGKREITAIIAVLVITAPIASSLSNIENSYIFRAFLLLPAFFVIIAVGIYLVLVTTNGLVRKIFIVGVVFAYLLSFINFIFFYFFRYPVKAQETSYLEDRILINYITRVSPSSKISILVPSPIQIYLQYLFFSNFHYSGAKKSDGNYILPNITITNNCLDVNFEGVVVADLLANCPELEDHDFKVIQNQKDSGTEYKIYNDPICKDQPLNTFRRDHLISDYAVERMNDNIFCNRWINMFTK